MIKQISIVFAFFYFSISLLNAQEFEPSTQLRAVRLNSKINSNLSEINPYFSSDGKTMFFMRDYEPDDEYPFGKQEVWAVPVINDTIYGDPYKLEPPYNYATFNAIFSESKDGKERYIIGKYDKKGAFEDFGISKLNFIDGQWVGPTPVKFEKVERQLKGKYVAITKSRTHDVIVMSYSDTKEDLNTQLYLTTLGSNGVWKAPQKLSFTIPGDYAPFIDIDDSVLYFSSLYRNKEGHEDIFMVKRLDDTWTKWTQPELIKNAINSTEYDSYLTINPNGKYIYTVSARDGNTDIYRFNYQEVKRGIRLDQLNHLYLSGLVTDTENKILDTEKYTIKYQIVDPSINPNNTATANQNYKDIFIKEAKIVSKEGKKLYDLGAQLKDKNGFTSIEGQNMMNEGNRLFAEGNSLLTAAQALNPKDTLNEQMKTQMVEIANRLIDNGKSLQEDAKRLTNLNSKDPQYVDFANVDNATRNKFTSLSQDYEREGMRMEGLGALAANEIPSKVKTDFVSNPGTYSIHLIPGYQYKMTVSAPGYRAKDTLINLKDVTAGSLKANFKLESTNPKPVVQPAVTDTYASTSTTNKPKEVNYQPTQPVGKETFAEANTSKTISDEVISKLFESIYFDFDKSDLRKKSIETLNEVAEFVKNNPTYTIVFTGHTDFVGGSDYNMKLSERRINSALSYLRSKGIDTDQFIKKPQGLENPLATNQTPEGRQLNRRVSFEIRKK